MGGAAKNLEIEFHLTRLDTDANANSEKLHSHALKLGSLDKYSNVDYTTLLYVMNSNLNFENPYSHTLNVGTVDEYINVDISQSFIDSGVNLSGLRSLRVISENHGKDHTITYLDQNDSEITVSSKKFRSIRESFLGGEYIEGGALVSGELLYKTINLNGTEADHRVKFSTIVWLFDRHLDGVPVMPTYEYGGRDLRL